NAVIDRNKPKNLDRDGPDGGHPANGGPARPARVRPFRQFNRFLRADDRGTRIAQFDLRTMRPRLFSASNRGLNITPVYTRDGKNIVWAWGGVEGDSPAELMLASASGEDSVAVPFVGRTGFETTSPSFSPDGK